MNILFKINAGGVLAYLFGEVGIFVLAPFLGGPFGVMGEAAIQLTRLVTHNALMHLSMRADWGACYFIC